MEHLRGVVERITFQSEETGFSVLKCRVKNYHDLVTVVGTLPDVHVGSVLTMGGSWRMDAKYGRQFSLETFEETLPATVFGIEKYLGSGLIKGVGPKFAGRIVRKFGTDTLNVIEEEPDRLLEVDGIFVPAHTLGYPVHSIIIPDRSGYGKQKRGEWKQMEEY